MKLRSWITKFPVISFCLLTFSITWGVKLLYAFIKNKYGLPTLNFGLIASFGPSLSALILIIATEGNRGLKQLVLKLKDRHFGNRWILLAFLFEPVIFLSITIGYWLTYNQFPVTDSFSSSAIVASYVLTFTIGLFRWGVAEEIGWRGWMLPKLQMRMSPILASLILSIVASIWHLNPNNIGNIAIIKEAEYIYGYFPEMVERLIITFPITMVITYIFNKTNGSLLPMIIFHSASNTSYFWVKDVFGIVGTDFFRILFTVVLVILTVIFPILLMKQSNKVTSQY